MRQVVTEYDAMLAVYDYLTEQLDDRLRYEFTNDVETIDALVEALQNPTNRTSAPCMKMLLANEVSELAEALTICMVTGCENNHDFEFEFIELVWNAQKKTAEWLRRQGVVVGLSAN